MNLNIHSSCNKKLRRDLTYAAKRGHNKRWRQRVIRARLRETAVLIMVYFIVLIKDNPGNNVTISRNVNVDGVFVSIADETMITSH